MILQSWTWTNIEEEINVVTTCQERLYIKWGTIVFGINSIRGHLLDRTIMLSDKWGRNQSY